MVNLQQIRDYVITPALQAVDLYSSEARDLMLYTGLVESGYRYVAQLGDGPARSFWQVEPRTMMDHYWNYLQYRPELLQAIESIEFEPSVEGLTRNLWFAVIMGRLVYRRSPDPLPALGDGVGMARMWKKVYNTPIGKGTEGEFLRQWKEHKIEV